jgi:hypothetical protein
MLTASVQKILGRIGRLGASSAPAPSASAGANARLVMMIEAVEETIRPRRLVYSIGNSDQLAIEAAEGTILNAVRLGSGQAPVTDAASLAQLFDDYAKAKGALNIWAGPSKGGPGPLSISAAALRVACKLEKAEGLPKSKAEVAIPTEEPLTPTVDEPVTLAVEEPVTPAVEDPVTPAVEELVTPAVEEPVTPAVEDPVTPAVDALPPETPAVAAPLILSKQSIAELVPQPRATTTPEPAPETAPETAPEPQPEPAPQSAAARAEERPQPKAATTPTKAKSPATQKQPRAGKSTAPAEGKVPVPEPVAVPEPVPEPVPEQMPEPTSAVEPEPASEPMPELSPAAAPAKPTTQPARTDTLPAALDRVLAHIGEDAVEYLVTDAAGTVLRSKRTIGHNRLSGIAANLASDVAKWHAEASQQLGNSVLLAARSTPLDGLSICLVRADELVLAIILPNRHIQRLFTLSIAGSGR